SQRFGAALRYAADAAGEGVLDDAIVAAAPTLDYTLVRDRFLAEARAAVGDATHVTDKLPANVQLVGYILQALPGAKIVHLRRDPMDLCFANLRELFADGVGYAYAFDDLAHYHACHRDLVQHWHAVHPGRILKIDYETLVREPLDTSRRVFEFCGLDWEPRVVEPVAWSARAIATLSAVQARQPVNTASIGRWRAYARQLAPLQEALARPLVPR
ncbi:MAG TPA: sulfotransferase, partial [Dokdonella sp.]